MRKFGLIGFPLAHSFSKRYFEEKFLKENVSNCSYDLFQLNSITALPSLINAIPELCGLNVTIPFKEAVIGYLSELDAVAKKVGAVNCLTIEEGKLKGFNTDVFGFAESLKAFLTKIPDQTFVLGTGGSSRAVCYVLQSMRLPFIKVSRQKKEDSIPYEEIALLMKDTNLFINTTPVGMFPDLKDAPSIPYEKVAAKDFLFDLIYNPEETLFLERGREQGAKTKNGLEMLELQAEKSWEIWNS